VVELGGRSPEAAAREQAPVASACAGKQFACLCMDVTAKELKFAVSEGFDSLELLKRYTTLSMGPCQGKSCLTSSVRLCADVTGRTVAETGSTTARPPWAPVALRTLAAQELVPRRETSMHDRHVDLGATFMWAGDWRRPHHYASETEEVHAVHTDVGLIDVSTLGKIKVKGPDAVAFLERVYPNRYGDLPVGRVRYGVALNDSGVILDDGTIVRMAEDEFFVTTTTSGAGTMLAWFRWWITVWGLDVLVLNVGGNLAAVNVTGPRSRDVMARVTDADVSAEGMPYLSAGRAIVAGVPALVLRIGFTGELGYEVHFPSAYGEHVWDALMDAGEEFGIRPFGLEAQRILRLEKQHILVGQDTDALSDPFATNLGWIAKMDKPDFLGRQALAELTGGARHSEDRLVGWTAAGDAAPPEGAAIVDGGRWIGRVTSARVSAAAGAVVGMARVPEGFAEDGRALSIHFAGTVLPATVHLAPFLDPAGSRLRS
ncbi:MAG TPA: glycine cleavage T C-terminal barrel domain-containing protein, partial [Actinomycetota bacterium]|nr:glycine cleavage T C-terminal barrel domain-containing protein [Actinomycetota bacterium]